MRWKSLTIGLALLTACGCSSMNNTEKGLLGGGAIGTGAGAAIGRGHPGAMLAGGLIGAAVGGMAGANQDAREDRKAIATAIANDRARNQMLITDIVQLSQRQTPDSIIIQQMDATRSTFNLTTADITYLQDQGVSPRVISAMQTRRYSTVVAPQRPVVVYEPYPPPPPSFGVGVTYVR